MSGKDMVKEWAAAGGRVEELPGWTTREKIETKGGHIEPQKNGTLLVVIDGTDSPSNEPVQPGESRRIAFSSSLPWCAKGLSVSADCARHFKLMSVRCGRVEYVPPEGVDCSVLSDAICVQCRRENVAKHLTAIWPTVFPGAVLELVVSNTSDMPMKFKGTFEADTPPIGYGSCL